MKKNIYFLTGIALLLCSCHQTDKACLIGTWSVDKVKVAFNENSSTPELVKQIGEMEKQNQVIISEDSTLIFKSLEHDKRGRIKIVGDDTLVCDGTFFGIWKDGIIVTSTYSPLGEVVVTYRKE